MPLIFEQQANPVYDARVAFFQLLLGFPSADIDGLFGPATAAAVRTFQGQQGLVQDGRVDQHTGRALKLPYWDGPIPRRDVDKPFRDPARFPEGHEFVFSAETAGGHFSSRPERFVSGAANKGTVRALRTNNPGALNISSWQKSMPGYAGRTQDDGHGNKTTIYLSPEKGVGAWHELVVVLYARKPGYLQNGTFSLNRLAKAYAGVGFDTPDSHPAVAGYLAGWRKWAQRVPDSALAVTEIAPSDADQLTRLAIAMFCHESSFAMPLTYAQVHQGVVQAQAAALVLSPSRSSVDLDQAVAEEERNGVLRAERMLRNLAREERGALPDEESDR